MLLECKGQPCFTISGVSGATVHVYGLSLTTWIQRTELTTAYFEVTVDGVRQECPHTPDEIQAFRDQVSEDIDDLTDNTMGPLELSAAMEEDLVESALLFTAELNDPVEPDTVDDVLDALEELWDEKFPGVCR